MATAVRRLLEQVSDPSTKAAYSELCFKQARDAANKAAAIAPFAVSDTEATTLERLGITTSPFATTSHTHSADKILENDCLCIIGHHLPKRPVTMIQLKRSKIHLLHRGPDQDVFSNYCHEPKDVLRYGITNPSSCPRVPTDYAVLADTLHFMSSAQLLNLFLKNPKLERLFATLVLPIEALHKLPSLYPEVYKIEYLKEHFIYMPGGHAGAAYVHSYHTLKWLSTGRVGTHRNSVLSFGCTDYLTIEKLETKAAHHIMFIQRRRAGLEWPLTPVWAFHASDMVRLPHIFYPAEANVQNAYSNTLVKRMQAYCFSVKAVALRDIFAKLRQVIETAELHKYSTADLVRLANYLLFTTAMQQVSDYDSFLTKGWLAKMSARIQARIRKLLEGLTGQSSYAALLTVLDPIPIPFVTYPKGVPAMGAEWFSTSTFEDDSQEDDEADSLKLEDADLIAELTSALQPEDGEHGLTEDDAEPNLCAQKPTRDGPQPNLHQNSGRALGVECQADDLASTSKTATGPLHGLMQEDDELSAELWGQITAGRNWEDVDSSSSIDAAAGFTPAEVVNEILKLAEGGTKNSSPEELAPSTDNNKNPHNELRSYSDFDAETTKVLKLHGFTELRQQYDGSGPISPVFFNPNIGKKIPVELNPRDPVLRPLVDLASTICRRYYNYQADRARATAYLSDVKNNLTGLVLPRLNRDTLSAWVSLGENLAAEVALMVIHGAGGAGKSRALQNMLREMGESADDINVIVPTANLLKDWKEKMPNMDRKRFMTFEKAFEREGNRVVIFDDYGKLPPGMIDAYIAVKQIVEVIIVTGDQRQSTYHTINQDAQTAHLPSNVDHFKPYCDYYVNATHRQPRRLANPIRVHAERQTGGAVHKAHLIKNGSTVLVPAHITQTSLTDLGRMSHTYSGCQGLTLPHVTIALDFNTPICSEEVLYTAFSRASESITFVNTYSDNPEFLAKLEATPFLKTLISGVREDEQAGAEPRLEEPQAPEPRIKTHLPVHNKATFLEDKIEQMEDKDTRELWDGREKTNLMQTQDPVIQLFPHQQAKDEALFRITIDQRIKTASAAENHKALKKTINVGSLLFEAYADFMKVPKEAQPFDRELWFKCRQTALRTFLSKPKSNLQQGNARQDPDFPDTAIALFNKSQWVKKMEKVGFKFKAGQTISAFKQSTVLITTTMALYLRRKRETHQPENVFIMCEKTPQQFNDFVVNRWDFQQPSYTSDYTQYDQSQDAAFLNFELRKARHFGVPEEVLEFYKTVKCYASTFVGNLAIMRLSGEGPTFDANTECNIAYDALRFQLNHSVNACYAGDDLVRDKVCPERPSWQFCHEKFALTAKPLATSKPDFCGWRLTPYGIVKSPTQLYQSLKLAMALGRTEEVKRSYAIDYLQAYKLGDKLYDIFDEKEIEAHQLTTRILHEHGISPPTEGSHLPTFHITSDRLINNPSYKEMHDASSDRLWVEAPNFMEDYL